MENGFTASRVTRLTGCTDHQLRYWDKVRFVQPSIQRTGGRPGVRRLYSFADLVVLRCVKTLKDEGLSVQKMRRAWSYLQNNGVLSNENGALVVESLPSLRATASDQSLREALQSGQMVLFGILDEGTRSVQDDPFSLDRRQFLAHLASGKAQLGEAAAV